MAGGAGGCLSPPRPCSGGEQPSPAASPISLGGVGSSRVPQAQSRVQEDEAAKAKQAASPWGSDNTSPGSLLTFLPISSPLPSSIGTVPP